ncbi:hypothetical protein BDD12DRAFT_190437 [Trichophaea hybrida]|nr:hypothetical protein BDD12DRAFT_190437 [Trichophaea hybrida]
MTTKELHRPTPFNLIAKPPPNLLSRPVAETTSKTVEFPLCKFHSFILNKLYPQHAHQNLKTEVLVASHDDEKLCSGSMECLTQYLTPPRNGSRSRRKSGGAPAGEGLVMGDGFMLVFGSIIVLTNVQVGFHQYGYLKLTTSVSIVLFVFQKLHNITS